MMDDNSVDQTPPSLNVPKELENVSKNSDIPTTADTQAELRDSDVDPKTPNDTPLAADTQIDNLASPPLDAVEADTAAAEETDLAMLLLPNGRLPLDIRGFGIR